MKEFSKEKVIFILHVMICMLFFNSDAVGNYNLWSCQKECKALTFLLDNICIKLGSKLYRQTVSIPVSTIASLVAELFCYVMRET